MQNASSFVHVLQMHIAVKVENADSDVDNCMLAWRVDLGLLSRCIALSLRWLTDSFIHSSKIQKNASGRQRIHGTGG